MDHDSTPFGMPGPPSSRIADVRETYAEFTRRGLTIMAQKITDDPAYRSNEVGHFAWDISLLVRAACLAWRVTSETVFLEQAVTWAQHMVERTDEALEVADWRGRCRPLWSAGERYTAGEVVIEIKGVAPVRLQAAARRVIVERPTDTTAIVRAVRADGSKWSSPEASLLPDAKNYLPDVLARRSSIFSVLVRGVPAPMDLTWLPPGEHDVQPLLAPHLVHTGLVARALLASAEALESAGASAVKAEITPEDLYGAAQDALLSHDEEIRVRSGSPWYITPDDFPGRRLGLELPHNHVADVATCFLILGRRKGNDALRGLGRALAGRFLGELSAYESGSLPHPWFYYPVDSDTFSGVNRTSPLAERHVPPVRRAEDSSHVTMRVRALVDWKALDDGLVSDAQMTAVAFSLRRFYMARDGKLPTLRWLPGDDPDAVRRGHSNTYAGAWGPLHPWDATMKRRINSFAYRHPPTEVFGATVLASAEILAMNAGVPTYASGDRTAQG